MKDTLIKQCLEQLNGGIDILKRDDVKQGLTLLFSPAINLLVCEMTPYVYTCVLLIFLIFIMILGILIILILILRNKSVVGKLFN